MATIEARKKPDGTIRYRVKIRLRGFPSQSATFERKGDCAAPHEEQRAPGASAGIPCAGIDAGTICAA